MVIVELLPSKRDLTNLCPKKDIGIQKIKKTPFGQKVSVI
jgi:hypothetical protein